jgi:hypothetical protein
MRRSKLSAFIVLSMLAGLLVVAVGTAAAHECWDADDPPRTTRRTRTTTGTTGTGSAARPGW